jgi:hypothetical protein
MHAFTPDGKHLAFIDAFGLTRLTFPGKVKTDRKAMASPAAPLSLDAVGGHLLAWDDGWDRSHLRTFPDLEPVVTLAHFELRSAWLHPDGQHLVKNEARLEVLDFGRDGVASHDLAALPARDLGALALGGAQAQRFDFQLAPDGAFVAPGADGAFVIGRLGEAGAPPQLAFRGVLTGAGRWRVHALPSAAQTVFAVHDRAAGLLEVLRVPAAGAVETLRLPAVGRPQLAGGALVYPRSAGEVVRLDLATRAEQVLPLPADLAAEASGRPGQVLAHPTRTLFVPWHGETFVELLEGKPAVTIDRKLPAKEQALRRALLAFFIQANQDGLATGSTFDLMRLEVKPGSYRPQFSQTRGDRSPAAEALVRRVYAAMGDPAMATLCGFRQGGYGSQG